MVVFKVNSPLNFGITVASENSSTVSEIVGLVEGISFAHANKISSLTMVSDSASAIKLVAEAMVMPLTGSSPLQKAVKMESILASKFNKVFGLQQMFCQLILLHQPSHEQVFDVFSELNASADLLCKSHAKMLAMNALPASSSPIVSIDIPRQPSDELVRVANLMSRPPPTSLSPSAEFNTDTEPSTSNTSKDHQCEIHN